jgi:hypothetical protein
MIKVGFSFRQTSLFIAALCFVAGAAHAGDKIPVVEDGRVSYIDSDEYAKTLQTAFSFVYASTLPALQVTPQCASGSMCLSHRKLQPGADRQRCRDPAREFDFFRWSHRG